jgi:mRNA interferase RelE/StbE
MNGLPAKQVDAILAFVYADLVDNPHRRGHPLRMELEGLHTARRGDFRVVYRIDDDEEVVVIELVATRADVYRRRS